jgi:hypothetical protein
MGMQSLPPGGRDFLIHLMSILDVDTTNNRATFPRVDVALAGGLTEQGSPVDTGVLVAINNTGGLLTHTATPLVYISGHDGTDPEISLAQADDPATLATHYLTADVANGATVEIAEFGELTGINTAAFGALGDPAYLSDTVAGAIDATAPVGANFTQKVGQISAAPGAAGSVSFEPTNQPPQVISASGIQDTVLGQAKMTALWTRRMADLALDQSVAVPTPAVGRGFVPGTGNELLIAAQGVPDLTVQMALGGDSYSHQGRGNTVAPVAILAGGAVPLGAGEERNDIVVIAADGTLTRRVGSEGAPAQPDAVLTAGDVPLARVTLTQGDVSIQAANVTDLRERGGVDGSKLIDLSVLTAALAALSVTAPKLAVTLLERCYPMGVFGVWLEDGDGAQTNGGGLVGATADLTLQGANYAVADDGGVLALLSATLAEPGYSAAFQLFPDAPLGGDAVMFGGDVPFPELAFDIAVAQASAAGNAPFTWYYSDGPGSWAALTVNYDNTGIAAQTGVCSFEQSGALDFIPPGAAWTAEDVNGQVAYWLRCEITTILDIGVINGTTVAEHELVTPGDGWLSPIAGTVTSVRASTGNIVGLHAAPVEFILMNFTTGESTAALPWAALLLTETWAGLTLTVSVGDVIGVICTADTGGGNDITNAMFELTVTQTA